MDDNQNPQINSTFFSKIQKLFSTDVILHNTGQNQLKVVDVNKIQANGELATNSLYDKYNKVYTTSGRNAYANINSLPTSRIQLYTDYEAMDTDAIIASALDIIADEVGLRNDFGEILQIRSSDDTVQKLLYNLFYDILNIEYNLWSWTRNMCKYGDFYLKLEISEKFGVYNVIPFSSYTMIRTEGEDPLNPQEVKFVYDPTFSSQQSPLGHQQLMAGAGSKKITFENYEISHFRLLSDYNYLPYGRSHLEPARKIFKQLQLMEDAMLIHRIVRAPEKRTFFINVGNIPPNEVEQFMQKTINKMKKTPYTDPKTGDYNLKFNVQNILEDFYIPVRGNDTSTKIETTKGLEYMAMDDINYLKDKLFAALRVPKAYLGYEKDLSGKSTLASEDIRFARSVERIQRIIVSELTRIAIVHLYAQGYDGDALTNFQLSLTPPSIIYDQERISLLKEKTDLAVTILDNKLLPSDWVYDHVYNFSQTQYEEYRDLIIEDTKRKFRINQIENEGNDPADTGEAFGTPHQLVALGSNKGHREVPKGYDERSTEIPDAVLGRPEEKASDIGTQNSALGKDRLGSMGMKDDGEEKVTDLNPPLKGGALKLEVAQAVYLQNEKSLKSMFPPRKIKLFEESNLLDISNILPENEID